jgi:hypothetical protein
LEGGKISFIGGKNGAWLCLTHNTSGNDPTDAVCNQHGSTTVIDDTTNVNQVTCTARQPRWKNDNPIVLTWANTARARISFIHCSSDGDESSLATREGNLLLSVFTGPRIVDAMKPPGDSLIRVVVGGKIRFQGGINGAWLCFRASSEDPSAVTCGSASNATEITTGQNTNDQCTAKQSDWERNPLELTWSNAAVSRISWRHCAAQSSSPQGSEIDNQRIAEISSNVVVTASPLLLQANGKINFAGGINGAWLCFRAHRHTEISTAVACSDPSNVTIITAGQNSSDQCTAVQTIWGDGNPIVLTWENVRFSKTATLSMQHLRAELPSLPPRSFSYREGKFFSQAEGTEGGFAIDTTRRLQSRAHSVKRRVLHMKSGLRTRIRTCAQQFKMYGV